MCALFSWTQKLYIYWPARATSRPGSEPAPRQTSACPASLGRCPPTPPSSLSQSSAPNRETDMFRWASVDKTAERRSYYEGAAGVNSKHQRNSHSETFAQDMKSLFFIWFYLNLKQSIMTSLQVFLKDSPIFTLLKVRYGKINQRTVAAKLHK